ncbi:riboflavin synthase [Helicobacter pametensis]|uniref:riboflavin synthase n=1 Tax=Helicobacter pametensis TaxID=95149 RepID=UPI000482CCDF|nr:riboflavin synthase [Helicobacter pametensis]
MFSGLVREIAPIKDFKENKLYIQSPLRPKIGDSIAVNGACLTVIENKNDGFILELTHHTQEKIATENLQYQAHIEPALQMSDRFDGHFVQGHIDAIGEITQIKHHHNQSDFLIQVPSHITHLLIPKGSITIDGISLTISECTHNLLSLTLIPHTLKQTLFHTYKVGRRVNIETDMIVRSIAHILSCKKQNQWDQFDQITLGY